MEKQPLRIANIANIKSRYWAWLRDSIEPDFEVAGRTLDWRVYSFIGDKKPDFRNRYAAARQLAIDARTEQFDLVVSHGPWVTAWTEWVAAPQAFGAKHLAFSYNFTDLPTGPRRVIMQRGFQRVDQFAVFTENERELYATYFGIPLERFVRAPWGVPPPLTSLAPKAVEGAYFAALGGEARDYAVLCEAARKLPDIKFVVVARPHNFDGLNPPENLEVRFNLPFDDAWGIVQHAQAAIVPLRSRDTPCGIVSIVGGMHLGKAQIVTDAAGAGEYIAHEETGLLVPAQDAEALANSVRRLAADQPLAERLGATAKTISTRRNSEAATIAFFKQQLDILFNGA